MSVGSGSETGDPVYLVTIEEIDAATLQAFDDELAAALDLYRDVRQLAVNESPALIVDLRQVQFMDSLGLQVLLFAHRTVGSEGGRLLVQEARGEVLRILEVSGAWQQINGIDDDEHRASH